MAFMATAASIALPPRSRMDAPTCEARTLSLATTPCLDDTIDRDCERSWAPASDGASSGARTVASAAMRNVERAIILQLRKGRTGYGRWHS